jgi:hypothetical protein
MSCDSSSGLIPCFRDHRPNPPSQLTIPTHHPNSPSQLTIPTHRSVNLPAINRPGNRPVNRPVNRAVNRPLKLPSCQRYTQTTALLTTNCSSFLLRYPPHQTSAKQPPNNRLANRLAKPLIVAPSSFATHRAKQPPYNRLTTALQTALQTALSTALRPAPPVNRAPSRPSGQPRSQTTTLSIANCSSFLFTHRVNLPTKQPLRQPPCQPHCQPHYRYSPCQPTVLSTHCPVNPP